jgi:hypothetical protein
MNKSSLLTLLLISVICMAFNAITGGLCLYLGGLASIVLSFIFFGKAKTVFGEEGKSAGMCCLINAIANIVIFLGAALALILSFFTFGIPSLICAVLVFVFNAGLAVWQFIAWNTLKKTVAPAVPAAPAV